MAREEMFRPTANGGLELTPHGQRMTEEAAAVLKALRQTPQREIDRKLDDAAREEINGLEALAQKTLKANPFSKEADERDEEQWREFAHACREVRPLFDALIKADEPNSESAQYKHGFLFRLVEAMHTIAKVGAYERLHRLHQRRLGGKNRPKAISPFTQFFADRLKRNPQASVKEVAAALIDDAREGNSGDFRVSNDQLTILTTGDRAKRLKVSGIPAAVTKAKKKLPRK